MIYMSRPLVQGRACGECTACCISLRIDETELKKSADVKCSFLSVNGGCSIYEDRPSVCRTWYCGWRKFPEVDESMRPDKCGLMIKHYERNSVSLMLIKGKSNRILWDKRTMNMICKLREIGLSISTSVPTRTGFCYALTNIDKHMTNDLIMKSPAQATEMMKKIYFQASHSNTDPEK